MAKVGEGYALFTSEERPSHPRHPARSLQRLQQAPDAHRLPVRAAILNTIFATLDILSECEQAEMVAEFQLIFRGPVPSIDSFLFFLDMVKFQCFLKIAPNPPWTSPSPFCSP